jgi:crossover junction endodeoxyribonuclease RuvC
LKDHYLTLKEVFNAVTALIEKYLPDEMAIEAPFFGKNVQSMLKLGRAQGVAITAALLRDIPITEYAPLKIKMAITGNGSATKEQVAKVKKEHVNALVLAHPECTKEVLDMADYIGSTAGIIEYAKNSESKEFIICTEQGVLYQLQNDSPDKKFYFVEPCPICKDMKLITLEKIVHVLETGENEITVSDELREKSLIPLDKMLELGK